MGDYLPITHVPEMSHNEIEIYMSAIQIAEELLAKAKEATPGPWQTRFVWRSLDAARKTHDFISNTKIDQDWPDAEYIASASPDRITQLAQAFLDAVKVIQWYSQWDWCADEYITRIDKKASDFLEKLHCPE